MLSSLETLNRVFEAGIAITALSLFLRALTFNLRDRVSRAFAVILACIMVSSAGEAVSGSLSANVEFWLRFQWVGIIFLPAADAVWQCGSPMPFHLSFCPCCSAAPCLGRRYLPASRFRT